MTPSPVSAPERISSIDALRGLALFGILLMNIVSFGLPGAAYMDPTVAGGSTGWNHHAWLINQVLFEGKMRAIFSMLFGAGAILLTSRAEERGSGSADIYCRRNLWLLLFGLLHGYFIWVGDILYSYAVTALILLYPFRKQPVRRLLIASAVFMLVCVARIYFDARVMEQMRSKARDADAAQKAGKTLTEEQKKDQKAWDEKLKESKPDKERIELEIKDHRSGYWTLLARRAKEVSGWQSVFFYRWGFFDTAAGMLLGMALLRAGVLSSACSAKVYGWMALAGYGIGMPLNWWIGNVRAAGGFEPVLVQYSYISYDAGRFSVALAHIAVFMLVLKAGLLRKLTSALAAVGQMALTNYLATSLICTTLFYGYGFGLFARLERYQLYSVVVGVWVFQLVASPIWLRYFRFGPMEWVWRSLSYWKRQPMRITAPVAAPAMAQTGQAPM